MTEARSEQTRQERLYTAVPGLGVAEAFERGDYTYVADQAEYGDWRRFAARGLMGLTEEALLGLARFQGEEPRFYEAVALWIRGLDSAAEARLAPLSLPHARRLLDLIRKPVIEVLVQMPWTVNGPQALLQHIGKDSRFSVKNIGPGATDLPNHPYASIWEFARRGAPPDFYFCQMVEWHLIPPDIQSLNCPILGQTADCDVHVQVVHPWLQLFDELIVTDHTEWSDVQPMVGCPVSTFPKTFGVEPPRYGVDALSRTVDCAVTGTLFQHWHPDKAALIADILLSDELTLTVSNGWAAADIYQLCLATSKVGFSFYRRGGGTVTRGLETLAAGCAVAVQRDSVLRFYYGEEDGVHPYDAEGPSSLLPVLQDMVARWPEVRPRAAWGARRVCEEFSLPTVASQLFRFLTFVASRPGRRRLGRDTSAYIQERPVMSLGWLLPGGHKVRLAWALESYRRESALYRSRRDPRWLNGCCREIVLCVASAVSSSQQQFSDSLTEAVYEANLSQPWARELLDPVLRDLSNAQSLYPDSLILAFNYVRVGLHLGLGEQSAAALARAREILEVPRARWRLSREDDVYSWDIVPDFFNYRAYQDLLVGEFMGGVERTDERVNLILASIHHYVGVCSGEVSHLREAVRLDPAFAGYTCSLASALAEGSSSAGWAEAVTLFLSLHRSTLLDLVVKRLRDMVVLDRVPAGGTLRADVRVILTAWSRQEPHFTNNRPNRRLLRG